MQVFYIVRQMRVKPLLMLRVAHGQRVARTAADQQMTVFQNGFVLVPAGKVEQGIPPMINASGCMGPAQRATPAAFAMSVKVSLRNSRSSSVKRLICDSQREHRFALLAGCFWLRTMRRNIVGHDDYPLQPNQIREDFYRLKMPIVYRVEGPAIHCL